MYYEEQQDFNENWTLTRLYALNLTEDLKSRVNILFESLSLSLSLSLSHTHTPSPPPPRHNRHKPTNHPTNTLNRNELFVLTGLKRFEWCVSKWFAMCEDWYRQSQSTLQPSRHHLFPTQHKVHTSAKVEPYLRALCGHVRQAQPL